MAALAPCAPDKKNPKTKVIFWVYVSNMDSSFKKAVLQVKTGMTVEKNVTWWNRINPIAYTTATLKKKTYAESPENATRETEIHNYYTRIIRISTILLTLSTLADSTKKPLHCFQAVQWQLKKKNQTLIPTK